MGSFVPTLHNSSYDAIAPTRPELSAKDKSVLITGGGSGIGAAIARSFAAAGAARIAINGRTESKLKATADSINKSFTSTKVTYYVVDVTDEAAVAAMFDSFGAPDILVNNAALLPKLENFKDADLKTWWHGFEVNVLGVATVTKHFLRTKEASKPAVVITISSLSAHKGSRPGWTAYSGSKAALLRIGEMLQIESPEIRYISVNPGMVRTDMGERATSGVNLQGVPWTEEDLTGNFVLWATSPDAEFLAGRLAWVNWDVQELIAKKSEILEKDLLKVTLGGF